MFFVTERLLVFNTNIPLKSGSSGSVGTDFTEYVSVDTMAFPVIRKKKVVFSFHVKPLEASILLLSIFNLDFY